MSKPVMRQIEVASSERLTLNMQRLVFTGEDLADFPSPSDGTYVKLLFFPNGNPLDSPEALIGLNQVRPVMRTYTIRSFGTKPYRLTIDFVLHGEGDHSGPASCWAKEAQVGDTIMMRGPGPAKFVNTETDWVFLVADMTALPALSCNLERLPDTVKGHAVIEINSEADRQTLKKPEGVQLHWVVNDHQKQSSPLAMAVKAIEWLPGIASVWAACEFSAMRELRVYFKQERNVSRDFIYISSYWKQGFNEEEHKADKRADAELNR